jgi:hypothetical protein
VFPLQTFPEAEFLECIKELVRVDESFIPLEKGYSLYIRPTMISTSVRFSDTDLPHREILAPQMLTIFVSALHLSHAG